jgi:ribonuclease HI
MSLPVLHIHTDGASRGNPGDAAFGYVIVDGDGIRTEEAGCLGRMTNNQAEYTALVRALEHALEMGPGHDLILHSDSELMVKQLNGQYRVKNADLRPLYEQARELIDQFEGKVSIRHVRRGHNARADALCNEALDGKFTSTRGAGSTRPTSPPDSRPTLRTEALECLRRARNDWRDGGERPSPEEVWDELAEVLGRHSVRLPEE